ncbi:hypothetical protein P3T16_004679 [Paraburkholderia sp. GAS42]
MTMMTTQNEKGRDSGKSATPTTTRADVNTGPPTNADLPVLDLQKNARERLRVTHTTFKGKPYIDLRVWFVDAAGDYQPSRSGVSIRPDHLAEIVRALTLAGRELPLGGA